MAWLLQEALACPAVGQACAGSQCRVSVGLPGAAVQHHQCLRYCGAGGEWAPDLGAAAGDQHQGRCSTHQCTEQQVMSRARCVTAAEDCYRAGHRDLQTVSWRTCIKSTNSAHGRHALTFCQTADCIIDGSHLSLLQDAGG